MQRRTYITALGSVGVFSVSGCSENGGSNGTPEPADMQLDSIQFQDSTIELREETTLELSVTNHGGAAGQGELWYRIDRDSGSKVVDLDGGETKTYTETVSFNFVGEYTAELVPERTTEIRNLSDTAEIEVGPKHLNWGDFWKNDEGYSIASSQPELRESYKEMSFSGEVETVKPEDEELFAFVPVQVENDGSGSGTVPLPDSFFARVEGELYEISIRPVLRKPDFRGDLDGANLYDSGEIPSGTTKNGFVVFEVPIAALDDIETGWSSRYGEEEVVYWE